MTPRRITIGIAICLGLAGSHAALAWEWPSWTRNNAQRIESAGIPIQELTAPLRKEGGSLAQCADLIAEQERYCSQYENWSLDIQVSHSSLRRRTRQVELQERRTGPGNQCVGTRAGWKYPDHIQSKSLDTQRSASGEEEQVVCQVTCHGWVCPAGEAELERTYTCRSGTQKPEDCSATCPFSQGYSCRRDPASEFPCEICTPFEEPYEPTPSPPDEGPACDFPDDPNCRDQCAGLPSYPTYAFEGCLTACDQRYITEQQNYDRCMEEWYNQSH